MGNKSKAALNEGRDTNLNRCKIVILFQILLFSLSESLNKKAWNNQWNLTETEKSDSSTTMADSKSDANFIE